jgi:hypothetical protein
MTLRRYEHPGKFEGGLIIDEYVYAASLDGCGETVGDDEGGESYTSVDAPLLTETDGDPFTPEELAFLANQAGAIVHESSDGFVGVTYFDDKDAYEDTWARLVASYADDTDDDEEEPDDTPDGWDSVETDSD